MTPHAPGQKGAQSAGSPRTEGAKPKVLIIGSRGKLGSLIAKDLEDEFEVHGADLAPPDDDPRYRQADITDFKQVLDLVQGMDSVVHLAIASEVRLDHSHAPDEVSEFHRRSLRVNLDGTYHILEAVRRTGLRRLVYMSSLTVVLGDRHRVRFDNATPLEPTNLYACTKIFGENLARSYWKKFGVSTISLRLGQPFPIGVHVDDAWRTNVRGRSIFAAVEDVCLAVRCALKTEVQNGVYYVVSASDNQRVDIESAREIGYYPRAYLTGEGIRWIEDGNYPPPTGPVVTYNPDEPPLAT